MGTKKRLEPVDQAVGEILAAAVEDSGLSYRAIRAETGMSINRIGIILRQEPPPATVGEVDQIARQVETTASAVVGEAERRVLADADVPDLLVLAANEQEEDPDDELEGRLGL